VESRILLENQILLIIIAAVIAAAALVQALAVFGMYRSTRALYARIDRLSTEFVKNVGEFTRQAEEIFGGIKVVVQKAQALEESIAATNAVVQKRVANIDAFLEEATGTARLQILRIQDVVDTASRSVEDAFESLHKGVLVPVTEVNAIVRAFKVGLDVLLHKRTRPTSPSRQDEEMFI
jgi:hypothetical protein